MSQQINLFEARLRPHRERLTGRRLAGALVVVLLLCAAATFVMGDQADRASARLAALQGERKALQDSVSAQNKASVEEKIPAALQSEIDAVKAKIAARSEVLDTLAAGGLGNGVGFSGVMAGFARQTNGEVWLTGFSIAAGGESIEIRGRLLDSTRLPAYVQRLSSEPVFRGREFAALTMQSVETDQAEAGTAAPAARGAAPRGRRYVEFVLRSEAAADAAPGGKK